MATLDSLIKEISSRVDEIRMANGDCNARRAIDKARMKIRKSHVVAEALAFYMLWSLDDEPDGSLSTKDLCLAVLDATTD